MGQKLIFMIINMIDQFTLSLISGIFIGGVAGYLGSLMITKRMGLVGEPLGHLALPGVGLALAYQFNVFLGALLAIILAEIFILFLQIKTKSPLEALTGLVFTTGVALGFLILPFSDEHQLEEALVGDITKISFFDTILSVVLSVLVFLIIRRIYSKILLFEISEDLAKTEGINVEKYNFIYLSCIAFIVALTVKLVGGLLPVALMVIPSLTAKNIAKNINQYSLGSLIFGMLSAISGILIYNFTKLSAGLMIVISGFLFFIISLFFVNRK
jgi:ABC-type Mn2+/Zn2+ transport system permease subunit